MNAFIKIAKDKGMADCASTVCATGGGAHKFEADFRREVNMSLNKSDEIASLIRGLKYIILTQIVSPTTNGVTEDTSRSRESELFYFENPADDATCQKVNYNPMVEPLASGGSSTVYPFLLVNIGSGVSILSVTGEDSYKRVYGTSLGGGTFLGLCCLLTGCNTFEEVYNYSDYFFLCSRTHTCFLFRPSTWLRPAITGVWTSWLETFMARPALTSTVCLARPLPPLSAK